MAREQVKISVANKGAILTKSTFNNYDACVNPYVGCEFGCTYCYVRFFVKDDEKQWGDFVRVRAHLADKLPKELNKGYLRLADGKELVVNEIGESQTTDAGKPMTRTAFRNLPISETRLVFGTMTDPYQPAERKHRITRTALEIITEHPNQFKKVGIFTRSPIVLDDAELIAKLPRARVHFTVTPYPADVMREIEPISPKTERRWEVLKALKAHGIRLHVNVSPVMPIISDEFVEEWAEQLAEIGPAEFFVDPMQAYKESFDSFEKAMAHRTEWSEIKEIMTTPARYNAWKGQYRKAWMAAWARVGSKSPDTLPIWCDHVHHTWQDMRTGEQLDRQHYNEDAR